MFILVAMTLYESGVVMGLENNRTTPTKFLLTITGRDAPGAANQSERNRIQPIRSVLQKKMVDAEIPPGFFRLNQYYGPNDRYDNETLEKVVMLADEHTRNFRESLFPNENVGVGTAAPPDEDERKPAAAPPEEDERKPAAAAVGRGRDQGGRERGGRGTGGRKRGRGGRGDDDGWGPNRYVQQQVIE